MGLQLSLRYIQRLDIKDTGRLDGVQSKGA